MVISKKKNNANNDTCKNTKKPQKKQQIRGLIFLLSKTYESYLTKKIVQNFYGISFL